VTLALEDVRAGSGRNLAASGSEFVLTWDDFRTIKDTLHADAGIALDESKVPLVYSRLAKRLRALGLESFRDYCSLILSRDGVDERQRMLAQLTTNVTRFFREPHHFEHLKTRVLPPLLTAAERGAPVRIWSAACSTGQEPYSIALTILSLLPKAANLDIKILATDIDPNVVATARAAEYPDDLVRDIPADMRSRWLRKVTESGGTTWRMADEVQELVRPRELNLIGDWPMKKKFHAIFCRNVVIYFDDATQAKVWARFATSLLPAGTLFIGHSERVTGPATPRFKTVALTTYELTGAAA
jgi:chemotaxis protein methyltransferase CheR